MKKGQLQIQETILVLFVFIVILAIGLIFFHKYNVESLREDIFEVQVTDFDSMLSRFPEMPEIKCSYLGESVECIDTYKLLSFKNLIKNEKSYYRERFGYKNITLYKIYPEKNNNECKVSSVGDCGVWSIYSQIPRNYESKLVRETPISIYFPNEDEYGIGKLVIEWYV